MTVKTSGREFKEFWHDTEAWPGDDGDTHMEDEVIIINGVRYTGNLDIDEVQDADVVELDYGFIMSEDEKIDGKPLDEHFTAWKSARTKSYIVVECDNDMKESVEAAIKAAGAKVITT